MITYVVDCEYLSLCCIFCRVSENCKLNSMDSKNLAICWWPTLLPFEFSDMGEFEQMRPNLEDSVQTMIDQFRFLFCGEEEVLMVWWHRSVGRFDHSILPNKYCVTAQDEFFCGSFRREDKSQKYLIYGGFRMQFCDRNLSIFGFFCLFSFFFPSVFTFFFFFFRNKYRNCKMTVMISNTPLLPILPVGGGLCRSSGAHS